MDSQGNAGRGGSNHTGESWAELLAGVLASDAEKKRYPDDFPTCAVCHGALTDQCVAAGHVSHDTAIIEELEDAFADEDAA